jgi:[protein-PII] uridylyltransferase
VTRDARTAGGPSGHSVSAVASRLKARHAALVREARLRGRSWCHAWSDVVDEALAELWGASPVPGDVTIVAVGGYGRREMTPASDVDLLLVHDGLAPALLEEVARAVLHPLWDAGLKVGHAVRSQVQLVGDALAELDTATAVLDGRVVAGLPERFTTEQAELVRRLHAKPKRFLEQLAAADQARRVKAGDAAEQLEPDVKNGAGGLRDVQSLRWAAAALVGRSGIEALEPAGFVGPDDRQRLDDAEDVLLDLRVALHLVTGTPTTILRMEHQQAVAVQIGEHDGRTDLDTAAHRALTRHFLAARIIEHAHDRAWRRVQAELSRSRMRRRPTSEQLHGLDVVEGTLRLPEDSSPLDPDLPERLMRALMAGDYVLDRQTAARLRAVADDVIVPFPFGEGLRDAFRQLLWSAERLPRVTAELDDVDWLVALLPEWGPMRGRPQRNPFHLFSLDRHAVHAAATLGRLVRDEEWATEALADVIDREALALGVLLHDVGKTFGEPHSETGVPVAQAVAARLGLDPKSIEMVGTLVRHHLLLPDVATRRDVHDPAEARVVAEVVGDRAMLSALWLLSAADGQATGPSAWSAWKASLILTLVTKVDAVLDERDPDALPDGPDATTEDAIDLGPSLGVSEDLVRQHLLMLPERYAAAVAPRAVVRHAGMASPTCEPTEVRTRVTPGEPAEDGTRYDDLDVIALDSPGLFANVAAVISLHGGSILEAHAHTREDGTAVDTFTVVLPEHATGSWWVSVEGDLVEAVAGRLAVRARVRRKQVAEQRRIDKLPPVATTVSTGDDAAGSLTLVEVHTLDRVGVLYRIAAALAELQLDLVVAKVATLGHEVVDVFAVRDQTGAALDVDHRSELELAITSALAE